MASTRRFYTRASLLMLAILGLILYFGYYHVVNEGEIRGNLINIGKKSSTFETYEGILVDEQIDTIRASTPPEAIFVFSVENDSLAKKLMANYKHLFTLHYKEYSGSLPWRGESLVIVDEIISIKPRIAR